MLPRFHVPDLTRDAPAVELPRGEGHHARHVLRLRPGDDVRVFDGRGGEWRATVARLAPSVLVELREAVPPAPEPGIRIDLVLSLLKGEHMDAAVRDAVMMGVSRITPVVSAHTVARPRAGTEARLAERWARMAVASAKQCGRAVVPAIGPILTVPDVVGGERKGVKLILAEPALRAGCAIELDALAADAQAAGATVLVGPEGGWAREELDGALAAGFLPWSLGPWTVRAEAVPTSALAVLLYAWGRHRADAPSDDPA